MTTDDDRLNPRVQRTREAVLSTVVDLLAREGLDAVTHTRVADEAGVGRATLYRHWPDLSALLVDAIRSRQASRGTVVDFDGVSLRDGARALAGVLATMLREDPMVPAMLALLERAERDPTYAAIRDQVAAIQAEPLDRLLVREQRAGRLGPDLDLDHAKAQLVGPLFFARLVLGRPLAADRIDDHVEGWLRAVGA